MEDVFFGDDRTNYRSIAKGSIIFFESRFYVVVSYEKYKEVLYINCICDNANNQYSWTLKSIVCDPDHLIINAFFAMQLHMFRSGYFLDEHDASLLESGKALDRGIPVEVIAEVLAGCHDSRF